MKIAYVLMLIYSPVSSYFNGFSFEIRNDKIECLNEIKARIGEEIKLQHHWETKMMGPVPKVIGGICAEGGFMEGAE